MATAATTQWLPSFSHQGSDSNLSHRPGPLSEGHKSESVQNNAEKCDIIQWSQGGGNLRPEDVAKDPNEKCVGQSAPHLSFNDFELIKILGTGKLSIRHIRFKADDKVAGTFARVWLVRLKNAKEEERNRVFALKVLRKAEGMFTQISRR